MIVLHAGLREGRFLLWAETPPTTSRRGRKPKAPTAQPFPFDAAPQQLAAALKEILPKPSVVKPAVEPCILWLPTVDGQPVASSSLIAEPPDADAKPTLAPWTVQGLPLMPHQAIELLGACM